MYNNCMISQNLQLPIYFGGSGQRSKYFVTFGTGSLFLGSICMARNPFPRYEAFPRHIRRQCRPTADHMSGVGCAPAPDPPKLERATTTASAFQVAGPVHGRRGPTHVNCMRLYQQLQNRTTNKPGLVPYSNLIFPGKNPASSHRTSSLEAVLLDSLEPRLSPSLSVRSLSLLPTRILHSPSSILASHVIPWWRRMLHGGQSAQPIHKTRSRRQEPAT